MESFEKVDQTLYDKFKIYLVTNFNLTFQESPGPSIQESFEIVGSEGKLLCKYFKDNKLTLNLPNSSDKVFQEILSKINEIISGQGESNEENIAQNSDSKAQELLIEEYADNSKKFY